MCLLCGCILKMGPLALPPASCFAWAPLARSPAAASAEKKGAGRKARPRVRGKLGGWGGRKSWSQSLKPGQLGRACLQNQPKRIRKIRKKGKQRILSRTHGSEGCQTEFLSRGNLPEYPQSFLFSFSFLDLFIYLHQMVLPFWGPPSSQRPSPHLPSSSPLRGWGPLGILPPWASSVTEAKQDNPVGEQITTVSPLL